MTHDAVATFPRRHAATRRFTLGAPRSFRVSADGDSTLFLRSAGPTDPRNSLWVLRRGDEPEVLFDSSGVDDADLTDAEKARRERAREQAGGVVTFAASPDLTEAFFVLGGELLRVDVATAEVSSWKTSGPIFDPQRQPKGSLVAYVSGDTVRVTDGAEDRPIPLPSEDNADENVTWGSAEFVAAEEMGRGRGFWWSPNGDAIAMTRVNTSTVPEWWIASPNAPEATPRAIRYPAAGAANAEVELWIVDPHGGPKVQVDWQAGEFEYLANVHWGEQLLCVVQSRDQRTTAILDVDPASGAVMEVQRDTNEHWVELVLGSPTRLDGNLLTVTDDGVARRLAVNGLSVTGDDVQVRNIVGVVGGKALATIATEPKNSVLATVSLSGKIEHLTDLDAHSNVVTGGGTHVVFSARHDSATEVDVRWHDGTTTAIESLADSPGFGCTPEFSVVGRRSLEVALCLPADHDGSPLPVLMDPYGGPHAQRVLRNRNAYATSQWFAEQGFAVVICDGRGTPNRGPKFEREVWGDLAAPVLEDQVDALHGLAATRPELDLNRVAIRGWSFGGYLAALAVLRRPDVFHAAVAGAPVTDWMLYDTHYTERYLGHPEQYPEHYEQTSLIRDAHLLERPLMLVHGLADDNVVAAHTLTLSQALLEAGRPHTVLPLSGVTHMTPQEQVAENLLHLQRDFLFDALS